MSHQQNLKLARTILITGSASGIGRAVLERVRKAGDHAIGVDLHDAEIQADLGTEAGRQAVLESVSELAPNGLDGVLAGAGISSLERAR